MNSKRPWGKSGLAGVMRNLNKHIAEIKAGTMRGYIRAAIIIRRSMDLQEPLIPVDLGNLRASWFVVTSGGDFDSQEPTEAPSRGFVGDNAYQLAIDRSNVISGMQTAADILSAKGPVVIFGFSANYAMRVHENYGAHFQRPGSGAGFLIGAIYNNKADVLKVILEEAKIP